ncbi:MAG: [protein-PII] uridylyltransferase [Pseudomonadota bacterium]
MLDLLKSTSGKRARTRPSEVADAGHGLNDPRQIIDVEALVENFDAVLDAAGSDGSAQTRALLDVARTTLEEGRAEIRRRFLDEFGGGDACVAEQSYLMDQLIRSLADAVGDRLFPAPNPTMAERFAIVAVGGYGRGELAPGSDIDLLFLLPYKRAPRVEQVVEALLYLLWDSGLKVGHAVRTVQETMRSAKGDTTISTSLLEARPLWGEVALFDELSERFDKEIVAGTSVEFVQAKLAERDERHQRQGDSRYALEPNIKEGKGGLRDLQTLFWIGKYLYRVDEADGLVASGMLTQEEADLFTKDLSFLRTLRCHLHYLTGRAEDRLTFDLQSEVGRLMGYTAHAGTSGVERFMKHYFLIAKDVGDLTRIFCSALEAENQHRPRGRRSLRLRLFKSNEDGQPLDGFVVDGGRLNVADDKQFRNDPVDLIRLFRVAQKHDLPFHPNALKVVTRSSRLIGNKLREDDAANAVFLEILCDPVGAERVLRRMNEAGVLGKFVPDWGRVVAQMQHDMYHVYTVDEHTLFAIGILNRIEGGDAEAEWPLASRVIGKIESRRALYVAMFCHDIAKGRGGDHSVRGARVAAKLGPRLGLSDEETETAVWLVRWHLLMSDVALKRDIDDEEAIADFASRVESPERLRLLLVLTTADISAVGPGRWNGWKATLLSQLFHRTRDILVGAHEEKGREARIDHAKKAVREFLPDWPAEDIDAFLDKGYAPYWLHLDAATHAHHARLLRKARQNDQALTVDTRVDRQRGVTEVTVYTADHPGLFSRLSGALSVVGASIVEARIFTMTDGAALDVFTVQDADGGPFQAPDKLARLSSAIERSLSGNMRPKTEIAKRRGNLPSRTRVFKVQPRVLIDNEASSTHTIIEVNGRDRPGLLHDVTLALYGLNLQITSAKVSTYGERAVDVFYVKDVFGLKVTHSAKLDAIRSGLLAALTDPDCAPAPKPAKPVRPAKRAARKPKDP